MASNISALVSPTKTMKMGDAGASVVALQRALAQVGYALTGTGYFGSQTDAAVEAFQKRAGLRVDGEVGPNTARAIDAATASPAPPPTKKTEIGRPLWLQCSLDHLGLREGAGAADNKELVADIQTVAPDYQHDATPWCAGWVSFCLARAGQKPSSEPLWALSYSDTAGQPVIKLAGPAVGAIAVKTRNGGGHVTFVAGRNKNGLLACCGGNQNDMVNISEYRADVFKGFYWPKGAPLPSRIGTSLLPIVTSSGAVTSES